MKLTGELDLIACSKVKEDFGERYQEGQDWLFDLTELSYIDSTAVRTLLFCAKMIRAEGGRVQIVVKSDGVVERVLRLIGVHTVFPICTSISEAVTKTAKNKS